jgi:acetoin:2,6-dichlorophenolindophenol oxidoreductase subunit alpha
MKDTIARLYQTMCLIRAFEDLAGQALVDGLARGSVHQYVGQEAVATGVCAELRDEDYIASYHRGHGHAIAKGVDVDAMFMELLGRRGGICGGKGGSMHIADFSKGMLGANGVVADGVTIAVGAAQSIKMLGQDRIVVAFFGDGALNRGPLLEAFNWANVFQLPILFVCEDNQYAVTQRTQEVTAGAGGCARAAAFGMPVREINGNDLLEVYQAARQEIECVREERRPRYLHAHTHRWYGHLAYDKGLYRDPEEVQSWKQQDCIARTAFWLEQVGFAPAQIINWRDRAYQKAQSGLERASLAEFPSLDTAYTDISDQDGICA